MVSIDTKILLLRKGVSQADLARHLGVSRVTVHQLLAGDLKTDLRLNQIAAHLGISRARLDTLISLKQKKAA